MKNFGFIRVAAATPRVRLANTMANAEEIGRLIEKASMQEVSLIAFPELCLTGKTCGDLIRQETMLTQTAASIENIAEETKEFDITAIIGAPYVEGFRIWNAAYVLYKGEVKAVIKEEDGERPVLKIGEATVGIEFGDESDSPQSPATACAANGADIIVTLSGAFTTSGKYSRRKEAYAHQSGRLLAACIYASPGFGESTGDHVFSGDKFIFENGTLLAEGERFQTESDLIIADVDLERIRLARIKSVHFGKLPAGHAEKIRICGETHSDFSSSLFREIDSIPFIPKGNGDERSSRLEETVMIQVTGLASRLLHINCNSAIVGVSGGLDSTLALLVTALAFDRLGWTRDRIIGVTMPGFGTTSRTRDNASDLMEALGITTRVISIRSACEQHFQDIDQDIDNHDITYENAQARERTQILMDISNQAKGIVVGTGDLSELALGWATYNGDHMSMYGVNASVPKTLIMHLVGWIADNRFDGCHASGRSVREILMDIIDTPISPELLPANEDGDISQITEDLVGPYELHDFFLYNFVHYGFSPAKILFLAGKAFASLYEPEVIKKWLRTFIWRFFSQQFKRSCLPDGPQTGDVSLSPRGGWNMPSDAKNTVFLDEIE